MTVCAGIKRDGGRCTATVEPPKTYCWWHDPTNAQARRRAAAKGGKGKAGRELTSIKQRLSELADDVLEGRAERGVAAVASQVLNVYLRAVSVELKVKEVTELEGRLEELEQINERRRDDGRWPA
jgi:hypothetical protein